MGYFIIVLILIVSVLLAAVVLVQNSKGGGLATGFQGASQIGGVQKTADFLEKSTWYLTIALFVLCILSASYYGNSGKAESGFQEEATMPLDAGVTEEGAGAPAADAPAE
jgi:preprotein translocase subunit SecG